MLFLNLRLRILLIKVVKKLKNNNYIISSVESCTSGLLASYLTKYPGSSIFFNMGLVLYSANAKASILEIDIDKIKEFAPVSKKTSVLMAESLANISKSDINISTTGLAGPNGDGGTEKIGTVYISIFFHNNIITKKFLFSGSRDRIKLLSCYYALKMIYEL